ncbi:MFS transporter [Candidatus Woesearchaeota archaeon]|nr:MFS transporter [Candidatus Woesearchaeota archaeon]
MMLWKLNEIQKLSIMNFLLHLAFLSPVITFFFQQRGLDYFQILSLESILVLLIIIFELPTGIIADKLGRKKAIILGAIFLTSESVLFLIANNYLIFALASALAGIGVSFLSGSVEAQIYDYLKERNKENQMKKAMGAYGSAALMAMVISPSIGSIIARNLLPSQFKLLLFLSIATSILGIAVSLFIKEKKRTAVKKKNSFCIVKEGLDLIRRNGSFKRIILLSIFSSPFVFVLNYLYQPYFKISNVDVSTYGVVFALAVLLSALLQKYAYLIELNLGMKRSIFIATFVPGILYLIMAFVFNPIFAVILFIFQKGIIGLSDPLFSDYKNRHIPSKYRATILSLISMFTSIYLLVMNLIIGKLTDINLKYSFVLMGGIVILASVTLRIDTKHLSSKKMV